MDEKESWLPFSLLILKLDIRDHLWAKTVCIEKVFLLQNIPADRKGNSPISDSFLCL